MLLKNRIIDGYRPTYQHVIALADLHCMGPLHFRDFCNIFQPNVGEDQINVLPSKRRAPGTVPYGKSGPDYCIKFIKKLIQYEGLRWQLSGQNPLISPGLCSTYKLVAQIELRGPGQPGHQFIVNYCGTRLLLYAKMLKETEIKKHRLFVTFLSLVSFQFGGNGPPAPPFGYAYVLALGTWHCTTW